MNEAAQPTETAHPGEPLPEDSSKVVALPSARAKPSFSPEGMHLERHELLEKFRVSSQELAAVKKLFTAMIQSMRPAQRQEQMALILEVAKSDDEIQPVALAFLIETIPKLELSLSARPIARLINPSTPFGDVRDLYRHITNLR